MKINAFNAKNDTFERKLNFDEFLKILGHQDSGPPDCGHQDAPSPGPARPRGVAWGTLTRVAGLHSILQ